MAWRITSRIWAIFLLSSCIGAAAAGFLYLRLGAVVSAYGALFDQEMRDQDLSRVMQVTFKKQVQEWKDILLRGRDPAALTQYKAAFYAESDRVREIAARLEGGVVDRRARDTLAQFAQAHQAMMVRYSAALRVFEQSHGEDPASADELVKGGDRAPTDLVDQTVALISQSVARQRASIVNSLWSFGVSLGVALLLSALLSAAVIRSITRALRRTSAELGESAEQVAGASAQVSSAGQALAQAATEHAATIEQTSASAKEAALQTRRNSERSTASAELVDVVANRVTAAEESLHQMVAAMDAIRSSSSCISQIIKAIDEIAFQTNILALNASVEAARAGEAGLGFTVVANEVRNLAQRSAQAARETAGLIEESVRMSHRGGSTVEEVEKAIRAIAESAGSVRALVDEVRRSSEEQAHGIGQIARAMAEMGEVTRQAAAHAEESAAAGEELRAQAMGLRESSARLRILIDGTRTIDAG